MADEALQQLAAAAPTASGHAPAGTSSQKVHGPTDLLQVVTALARLGITHDRHLQEIENQMTLTIWIYDATMQTELQVTRQAWVDSRLQGERHPSGMSQRVVMWCKLIISLRQAYAAIMPEEVQELSSGQKERVIRKTVESHQVGKQLWLTGAVDWPEHSPFQKFHPAKSNRKSFSSSLRSGNLSRESLGSGTWSVPPQQHWNSNRTLQHWQPSARNQNRSMWHQVACETAQSFLLSPNGSTLNRKARAGARTRETVEITAGWTTKPPWAWMHWETTTRERNHEANADAGLEIHRRGGGRSPPRRQCIACCQNSPPSLCATGGAWRSAEPRNCQNCSTVCEGNNAIRRGYHLRERARRPPVFGTTFSDTCGPRAF